MSKKKKSEQPMELNEAALEATSGGTIMNRIASVDENNNISYEWAATAPDGKMQTGLTLEQALAFNRGKGSSKDIKAMKEDGWRMVKFE